MRHVKVSAGILKEMLDDVRYQSYLSMVIKGYNQKIRYFIPMCTGKSDVDVLFCTGISKEMA